MNKISKIKKQIIEIENIQSARNVHEMCTLCTRNVLIRVTLWSTFWAPFRKGFP